VLIWDKWIIINSIFSSLSGELYEVIRNVTTCFGKNVSSYKWEFLIRNIWNWPLKWILSCLENGSAREFETIFNFNFSSCFYAYILCAVIPGNFLTNIPVKESVQKICQWPVGNDWLRMVYSLYFCRYLYQHGQWWAEPNTETALPP